MVRKFKVGDIIQDRSDKLGRKYKVYEINEEEGCYFLMHPKAYYPAVTWELKFKNEDKAVLVEL